MVVVQEENTGLDYDPDNNVGGQMHNTADTPDGKATWNLSVVSNVAVKLSLFLRYADL